MSYVLTLIDWGWFLECSTKREWQEQALHVWCSDMMRDICYMSKATVLVTQFILNCQTNSSILLYEILVICIVTKVFPHNI